MATTSYLHDMASRWWALAIRGVVAILFGIAAFLVPGPALAALVLLYGAFAFVDGVFALVAGARARAWALALFGLLGLIAGIVTFLWPGITALALLYVIAAVAIVRGVLEIVTAIELRRVLAHEWALVTSGVLSLLFGVLIAAFPRAGALGLVWAIAAYAIVVGVVMLALAFRLRGERGPGLHRAAAA